MQSTKALAHLAKVPEGYQLAHGDIKCQGLERFCEQCLVSPVNRIWNDGRGRHAMSSQREALMTEPPTHKSPHMK